ncbi:Transcriptional regulator, LysR family [Nostocoides japonicum T1-X7]|uniref:Transcriptional regulator, LysR family n=1 Tax=Nostocoides japonicum T1-X7 TaxID=1194083 RepID=A0A077M199_9MICO|nr:LysR family transcriptional regulator [Tetrasphaera japonica]CCH77975.1 Transcriptional regulator, LysR family [Tetrasphaera japonica T1-X7]
MDRRHLEYFVAVAEQGSFTRGASSLAISQPSLSHAIAFLERDLGAQLFARTSRGTRLTPAGEALLEPARRALRSIDLARGAVQAVSEGEFGQLSIIANTLWAVDPLARMIGTFRILHPGVRFSVADPARRSEVLESVRVGAAELGLVDGRPPVGVLESRWLTNHELLAVIPPNSSLTGQSVTFEDLLTLGLVSTPEGTALRALMDERLEEVGRPSDVAVETAHLASVVPMILAGAGASLLPQGLARAAAEKGARLVRLEPPARASVYIVWRSHGLSSLGHHFLDVTTNAVLADRSEEDPGRP